MRNVLLIPIPILILVLNGCSDIAEIHNLESVKDTYTSVDNAMMRNYRVICLDGIEYYKSRYNTSVKIDKNTLMPKSCKQGLK